MNTSTDAGQRALAWPPTEQQLNDWLADIVEVLWSKSSATYIRAGTLQTPDIKAKYVLRDILKPWAEAAHRAAFASPVTPAAAVGDSRLQYDDRGDINAFVAWALKPGQPTIVAVCTSAEICERYRPVAEVHHRATFYVEPIMLDHAFGRRDVQSAIYAAAMKGNRHDG